MHLSVRAVSKRFVDTIALEAVSLEIEPGQVVAVLGDNGAGKTTLLRCMSGLATPDSGAVAFDNVPFSRQNLDLRRRIGVLPDAPIFFPENTVLEHIELVLDLYKTADELIGQRVALLLEAFGMAALAPARIDSLSRGQAYKAAIAALLAAQPEILLVDEPFASGMDPTGFEAFGRACRAHVDGGGTLIYTTQIVEVIQGFADRCCILHRGRVQAFDTLAGIGARVGVDHDVLNEIFRRLHQTGSLS